jgi:hypothetical protein
MALWGQLPGEPGRISPLGILRRLTVVRFEIPEPWNDMVLYIRLGIHYETTRGMNKGASVSLRIFQCLGKCA